MKSLTVFCSSKNPSPPFDKYYIDEITTFAKQAVKLKYQIIYGGSFSGLMGILYNSVVENGGKITGIIPKSMHREDGANKEKEKNLIITKSIHKRKKLLLQLGDGFIVFPGGIGTMDELFFILEFKKHGLHNKPIGVVNVMNLYAKLNDFFEIMVNQGFIDKGIMKEVFFDISSENLLRRFGFLI